MNKIYLSLLSACTIVLGLLSLNELQAQERVLMIEHFTQASCGPCASQNPILEDFIEANEEDVVAIKYQVSWPGYDPMYLDNTVDVNSRRNYYGISSVPRMVIDGGADYCYEGSPASMSQAMLDSRLSVDPKVEIDLQSAMSPTFDSIHVTMTITALEDISYNMRAHIGVIEKEISWDSSPGSNGETEFFNVMKKMLPSGGGNSMGYMDEGDVEVIEQSWAFENVYDLKEISTIAWVQNLNDKEVHNAVQAEPLIESAYEIDAAILGVSDFEPTSCDGSVEPTVLFRNLGNEPITAMQFLYLANGSTPIIHTWEADEPVEILDMAEIQLPPLSFSLGDENLLSLQIYSVNGDTGADGNFENNEAAVTFAGSPVGNTNDTVLYLDLETDSSGVQTTWEILNEAGLSIASGFGYGNNQNYTETIPVNSEGCYKLLVYDSFGNGMCCLQGDGSYVLRDANDNVLASGGDFGFEKDHYFTVEYAVGVEEEAANDMQLTHAPQPANDHLQLSFLPQLEPLRLQIMDINGRLVGTTYIGAGESTYQLNTSTLASGTYFYQLADKAGVLATNKMIVMH